MKKTKGFTIIELLVVVTIIALLTSIGAVSYVLVQQRGRDVKRKSDLNQVKTALAIYYNDSGTYPAHNIYDDLAIALVPNYIKELPKDPTPLPATYHYWGDPPYGKKFVLGAKLENASDPVGPPSIVKCGPISVSTYSVCPD